MLPDDGARLCQGAQNTHALRHMTAEATAITWSSVNVAKHSHLLQAVPSPLPSCSFDVKLHARRSAPAPVRLHRAAPLPLEVLQARQAAVQPWGRRDAVRSRRLRRGVSARALCRDLQLLAQFLCRCPGGGGGGGCGRPSQCTCMPSLIPTRHRKRQDWRVIVNADPADAPACPAPPSALHG